MLTGSNIVYAIHPYDEINATANRLGYPDLAIQQQVVISRSSPMNGTRLSRQQLLINAPTVVPAFLSYLYTHSIGIIGFADYPGLRKGMGYYPTRQVITDQPPPAKLLYLLPMLKAPASYCSSNSQTTGSSHPLCPSPTPTRRLLQPRTFTPTPTNTPIPTPTPIPAFHQPPLLLPSHLTRLHGLIRHLGTRYRRACLDRGCQSQ